MHRCENMLWKKKKKWRSVCEASRKYYSHNSDLMGHHDDNNGDDRFTNRSAEKTTKKLCSFRDSNDCVIIIVATYSEVAPRVTTLR